MARLSPAQKAAYELERANKSKAEATAELKVKKEKKALVPPPPPEPVVVLTNEERIVPTLSAQHPLAGVIGEVLMEKGGKSFIADWADENPARFMQLVTKLIPTFTAVPEKSTTLTIRIESSLGRTELDDDNVVSYQ